jgi:small multidrug resistance family-3 protein
MFGALQSLPIWLLLVVATALEATGDAAVRLAIYNQGGLVRAGLFVTGAALLLGYGCFVNTPPVDFGRVVGLYIATLFIVWQSVNFMVFRALPGIPILLGGALVVAGGLITTFWRTGPAGP